MKAVILAGGLGTRLSEETSLRPKPMVEVGGHPIMWHIMKTYAAHGVNDFVVCCGYKGEVIKDYFANYAMRRSDVTFDLGKNEMEVHRRDSEDWRVTLVDTGADSMTGGRLKRVREHVGDETFCFTYGDGVTDADISAEIAFHRAEGLQATMMAVQPAGRFGALVLGANETKIESFQEKPQGDGAWINAGYFVLEPSVIDYIDGDDTVFEQDPLRNLAHAGQLNAYKHAGFWQPMDTLRDKNLLETLWSEGKAPWKVWN
ncbi:glucose-1-phosphate cytidylyltransferase [Agilicoccus flavus]|uniref:glucose-1-phosphate cytidylyltransferase n=1 Tax=Agilicoccus flavus TaxID=2775968 RepID=UPI001CF70B5D|nr:glucose-1-phosphate cytidylyltransferase [Agilicoccus flavus]